MKRFTLIFVFSALIAVSSLLAQTVNVTLRVNMQDQTVSPDGVHVAGSFQGWDPAATEMTSIFGNVYEYTFAANPGDHLLFKFINGNDWPFAESVPAPCGEPDGFGGYNRYFDVGSNDTSMVAVCFGSCLPCSVPTHNVTFQVDMTNETVSPDGVHVAGSFNGWDTDSTEMLPIGNNIYAATLELNEGGYYEFKYLNGNAWGTDETVPASCANGNNRYLTVPATDTTTVAVCFGSCDPCSSITYVDVTFQVDMSEVDSVSTDGVHIAGSFQGWDPSATLMTDNGNGIWSYTATLESGNYYEYKYINGTAWGADESVPPDCNQNGNRYLTAPLNDSTIDIVCFASCTICNPPLHDVTFTVDMSTQNVSPDGVHIAGSFQGWDPAATPMTNVGGNYYQVTLSLGESNYYEYKFINGNTFDGAEFVPGECNQNGNRYLTVPAADTTLDTVCFGECSACTTQLYTFNLTVFLEGPFNGSTMNTALYDNGVLPNDQPFNTAPWNYDGWESLNVPPETPVVDWVLIEFRETAGDATTATADKFLDHQAALLLEDGSVVKPDGVNPIQLNADITENLYVVIYQRNHLAVMSSTALPGLGTTYSYDFTTALSKAYLDGQKDLGGGYFGMIAGDSDGNGMVDQADKDTNWTGDAGSFGYFGSDLNLDSQVNNPDKNGYWEPNLGSYTQIDLPLNCGDTFTDLRDGQTYTTVLIGTQCWMAQNLNFGTRIDGAGNQTDNGIIEKYCYDDTEANCNVYGGLYQWDEMMEYSTTEGAQGICPNGWHVPTDAEWTTMTNVYGGLLTSGGALKESGTTHWNAPNTGATNASGFTGLPGGGRADDTNNFALMGDNGLFWTSTQNIDIPPVTDSWSYILSYDALATTREHNNFGLGISVRCVKN